MSRENAEVAPRHLHLTFLARLRELRRGMEDHRLEDDAILGIGFLVGAGFPYAAAALAYALDLTDRDGPWPWSGPDDDAEEPGAEHYPQESET